MKCEDVIEDLRSGAVPLGAALDHLAVRQIPILLGLEQYQG